jgi:NitT/TauT family transport system substrate-binding protein
LIEVQQRAWVYIFAGHEQGGDRCDPRAAAGHAARRSDHARAIDRFHPLFETPATKGKPVGWQAQTDWENTLRVMREVGMAKTDMQPADMYTNKFISDQIGRAK